MTKITIFGFFKSPIKLLAAIVACAGLDAILNLRKTAPVFPLSGLVTSFGTFLLTDSPYIWPYVVVGAVASFSKHLIRFRNRHVFNPNNFGLVTLMLLSDQEFLTSPGRWDGRGFFSLTMAVLGFWLVTRANRWALSLSFLVFSALCASARSAITGTKLVIVFGPLMGPAFVLFSFYMISDPATTPSKRADQIWFGASIALLDQILRFEKIRVAPVFALFLVSAAYSYFRFFENEKGKKDAEDQQREKPSVSIAQ